MIAIRDGNASFFDGAGLREWLESNDIAALTSTGKWPTIATAELWKRFRDEMLSGFQQRWNQNEYKRALARGEPRPENGIYRVEIDGETAWIATPDFQRIARIRDQVKSGSNGFFSARFVEGDNRAHVQRFGFGRAAWQLVLSERQTLVSPAAHTTR